MTVEQRINTTDTVSVVKYLADRRAESADWVNRSSAERRLQQLKKQARYFERLVEMLEDSD